MASDTIESAFDSGGGRDTIGTDDRPVTITNAIASSEISMSGEHSSPRVSFEPPEIGRTLDGRYVLERVLASGATGVVYEASHNVIGKRVAIKCLHPTMAASPVAVERLYREARIAAGLRHPNVMQVFDAGRDGETYFLTMELLEGERLTDYLARGPYPVDLIIRMFLSIMDGVAAVQAAGVVHRDLKPDNVFLVTDEDGSLRPKVLDFGVSKLAEPGRRKLTALGMTMGTPYYMAPEQMTDSASVDSRADVFSLGVMLYEALTGEVPYPGDNVLEIFNNPRAGRPTPIRTLRPDVPRALESVLARALCPDRDARFENVRVMRDTLAAVPSDPTDLTHDDSDPAEPWMLGSASPGPELAPLETAPTMVATVGTTTVTTHIPLPAQAASKRSLLPWIVAGAAMLVLGSAALALAAWALFSS